MALETIVAQLGFGIVLRDDLCGGIDMGRVQGAEQEDLVLELVGDQHGTDPIFHYEYHGYPRSTHTQ